MLSLLFFHFPVTGHLGSFHFLVTMNKAAVDFLHTGSCANVFSVYLGEYLRVQLLGHMVRPCLIL